MVVEPITSLMKKIRDLYNSEPEGWNVMTDYRGNVLVLGPSEGYRLKLISINPQEHTGVGIKIGELGEIRNIVKGIPSYGFRPVSSREKEELFNSVQKEGVVNTKLIERLLHMKPVSTRDIKKDGVEAILSGPVITYPNLNTVSKTQVELEAKLAMEADKLFRNKYPHRAAIYR